MDTSKQKPDLMGTSRSQPDGAKRILAHLEHGARLPASKPGRGATWTLDGWTLGLGMLLLAMCGIAWLMHERAAAPSGFKAAYNSMRAPSRQESKYKAMQAKARLESAQAAPVEVIVEPAELPAAIVNDPAPLQAQNKNEIQTTAATGGIAAASAAPPAPTPGLATSTATTMHAASVGTLHPKPAATVAKNGTSDNPIAGTTAAALPYPPPHHAAKRRRCPPTPTSLCSPRLSRTPASPPSSRRNAAAISSSVKRATAPPTCWRAANS